jgi:hypothetical protein
MVEMQLVDVAALQERAGMLWRVMARLLNAAAAAACHGLHTAVTVL